MIEGVVPLGPANRSAMGRFASLVTNDMKAGKPIPKSPFCEWVGDRVCGEDKQDCLIFLQGRRGSGKSYSALYIAQRIATAIAARMGGSPSDYFDAEKNTATLEDTQKVMELLNSKGQRQIVVIDDASLAVSNRAWNSPQNRAFSALCTVCRTQRWVMILTSPLKKSVDNSIREMVDVSMTVYHSFHRAGFNIIKILTDSIGLNGKEYSRRLSYGGQKVDFWVALKPDDEITKAYDRQREASAKRLSERIALTGSHMPKPKAVSKPDKDLEYLSENGERLKSYMRDHPGASINSIAGYMGIHYSKATRLINKVGGI